MTVGYSKAGVFAYVSTPQDTTCVNAGDWYRLEGVFTNEIMKGFSIPTTLLTYNGQTKCFQVVILGTFTCDTPATIGIGLYKNGSLELNSVDEQKVNNANDTKFLGLCDVFTLSETNTIEIRVKSNQAGAIVKATHLTTTLSEF